MLFRSRRLKPDIAAIAIGLAAFVAVGPLHVPMAWAILVLAPLSVALMWGRRR